MSEGGTMVLKYEWSKLSDDLKYKMYQAQIVRAVRAEVEIKRLQKALDIT